MVKALPKLLLLFSFCFFVQWTNAQVVVVDLTTFTDTPVSYTFLSGNQPAVSLPASFGDVSVDPTGLDFQYEFTYTPDPGFNGSDESRIIYFPLDLPNSFALIRFNINVVPVELEANHDIASTLEGNSISIPVLANDYSTTGTLNLIAAPAVNGGTVEVVGDEIVFTPSPGFKGLSDFNYVVCATSEDYDFCKTGTVSVNVLSNTGTAMADTTRVFVKRHSLSNPGALLLAPANYDLQTLPTNGVIDYTEDIPRYQPIPGHVGIEYLTYSNGNDLMVFQVETLDMVYNDFTVEDETITSTNHSVSLNVVENDLYGSFSSCVTYGAPQFGSLIPGSAPGQVTYVPPSNWSGIDRFTYSAFPPGCVAGTGETQTVTVIVSDFEPAASDFTLTTVANTDLPFTYAGPNDNVTWSVITPPNVGTILATEGLTYRPPSDFVGTDVLVVEYCLLGDDGACLRTEEVSVTIDVMASNSEANCSNGDDCVWPGDTNNDGVVSIADLLPIGHFMGSAGTSRSNSSPGTWSPQVSSDWSDRDNGVNRKHVDANGDQFVTSLDTQIVRDNLGMVSRIHPNSIPAADFDFIIEGDIFAEPGDIIELKVSLGSNYIGVEDVIGFIFPFDYEPTIIDPGSIIFDFDNEGWFSYDSPTISMATNDVENGNFKFALSRTSGIATNGHGQIASLYIGVEDVIGFRPAHTDPNDSIITPITIGGETGEAMNNAGHRAAVRVQPFELNIVQYPELVQPIAADIDAFLDDKLMAFPNPTRDQLTVHLNGRRQFTALSLTDITGRRLEQYDGPPINHRVLDLGQLPNGVYTLQVTTAEGIVNRKIQVFR